MDLGRRTPAYVKGRLNGGHRRCLAQTKSSVQEAGLNHLEIVFPNNHVATLCIIRQDRQITTVMAPVSRTEAPEKREFSRSRKGHEALTMGMLPKLITIVHCASEYLPPILPVVNSYASHRPAAGNSAVCSLSNLQKRQPDQRLGMDPSSDGLQFDLAIDSRHLLRLQSCTFLVSTNGKGGANLSTFENLRTSAPMRKATQRARVVLDLFFLVLTLSCLGFALYKSLH